MQYYGMANDIDLLGDHYLLVDDGPNGPDTLSWGAQPSFGFTGPLFSGALDSSYTDVGTLTFYNHYFIVYDEGQATAIQRATDSAVYNDLWTGWRTRTEGVRKLNERVKMIGTEMRKRKLEWRDAYSVHHQSRKPGTTDTNIATVRPLPTDEIITEVTTRHPVTGVVDSTWATFVELGLFFTKTEDAAEPDPLLDTNHVYVVNRRTFERPDDISATTARGRKMDTLTESREISLTFHLENPDTTEQYNRFIRVREVLPDTSALHLLGTRHTLDTVLSYDVNERATVDLVLGPGQGTLLEVTYPKPDESTEGGQLDRNNQRKVLYEPAGDRYYMTWQKYDSVAGIDHIYLRRSLPMGDKGAVLWEATSINLSESTGALDLARTINSHPSMTYRRINDSLLIASVVWTAHPNSPFNPGDREVLLREVAYEDYYDSVADAPVMTFSPTPVKVSVGYHDGLDANEWGTPVISTARFGEYIAWSDSSFGIVARGILLDSTVTAPITWAATDTVNTVLTDIGMMPGQYPAMPPFAHREIDDSTVAIVWQQTDDPTGFAPSTYTGIFYARLQYVPPPTGPAVNLLLTTIANTVLYLSPYNGYADAREFLHPTIDQSQDALGRVMEAAGFERYYVSHTVPVTKYRHELAVQNVIYDTATSDATFAGNLLVYTENPNQNNLGYSYPVISSENQILDVADTTETPLFVITSRMQEGGPSTRGFRILEST